MKKFIIDDSFFNLFEDAKIGVLLLKNINASMNSNEEIKNLLLESNEIAKKFLKEENFSDNEVIKIYREAYQKFKTKKGARCSIEALLKRVKNNNPVSSINALVDIYNSASLRYGLPIGAEDSDTFCGDLQLTITKGGDEFYLIGEEENNPTLENELCYKDEKGAVCRCFNWRDGARTMITEKTKNVFLVIELLDTNRLKDLDEALNFIKNMCLKYLGVEADIYYLDKNNKSIKL